MKVLHWIIWISGIIALVLMLLGAIAMLFGKPMLPNVRVSSYYIIASTFLLLSIACILYKKPSE